MKKLKNIGKFMILGGGLLAGIMLIALARSFFAVPDGSSSTVLAEAITPWNVFATLGLLIFFAGVIAWVVGWFLGRRDRKKEQINNIEKRLKTVEEQSNLA